MVGAHTRHGYDPAPSGLPTDSGNPECGACPTPTKYNRQKLKEIFLKTIICVLL